MLLVVKANDFFKKFIKLSHEKSIYQLVTLYDSLLQYCCFRTGNQSIISKDPVH